MDIRINRYHLSNYIPYTHAWLNLLSLYVGWKAPKNEWLISARWCVHVSKKILWILSVYFDNPETYSSSNCIR